MNYFKSGQPIAETSPINSKNSTWKRDVSPISLRKNISTTQIISEERLSK